MNTTLSKEMLECVTHNAYEVFASLEFHKELEALHISRYQIMQKKALIFEFRALYLALWHLALERSFPQDHAMIYVHFLAQPWLWKASEKEASVALAMLYYEKLHERGLEDFSAVARHILSLTPCKEEHLKAYILKLALIIRAKYTFFFNTLF